MSSFPAIHSRKSVEFSRIVAETDAPELDFDDDEAGRLPPHTAFPLILLLSLASWAVVIAVVLWLSRVLG